MKFTIHRAGSRGHANHGWLKTWHTFSFANYYCPNRMHFGALRVLNDDNVQASMGFGMHPHENMEIITIVLDGQLEHKDSMGNGSVIRQGEVQVMSAGTGIQHSEFNPSETNEVSLLQIWVFPDQKDLEPRYDQSRFPEQEMNNQWRLVIAPQGEQNSLWIHQQAWFSMGIFEKGKDAHLQRYNSKNNWYIFVISGSVRIGDETFQARDGVGIEEADDKLSMEMLADSKILAMELPG